MEKRHPQCEHGMWSTREETMLLRLAQGAHWDSGSGGAVGFRASPAPSCRDEGGRGWAATQGLRGDHPVWGQGMGSPLLPLLAPSKIWPHFLLSSMQFFFFNLFQELGFSAWASGFGFAFLSAFVFSLTCWALCFPPPAQARLGQGVCKGDTQGSLSSQMAIDQEVASLWVLILGWHLLRTAVSLQSFSVSSVCSHESTQSWNPTCHCQCLGDQQNPGSTCAGISISFQFLVHKQTCLCSESFYISSYFPLFCLGAQNASKPEFTDQTQPCFRNKNINLIL